MSKFNVFHIVYEYFYCFSAKQPYWDVKMETLKWQSDSGVTSRPSFCPLCLQVMGWVPWLCQRGDGWLSRGGGGRLGVSTPGIKEDAVLWKPLWHVLQPEQPSSRFCLPPRLSEQGGDQPGVSKRERRSSGRRSPPSRATVSCAAVVVLGVTTPKKWD